MNENDNKPWIVHYISVKFDEVWPTAIVVVSDFITSRVYDDFFISHKGRLT